MALLRKKSSQLNTTSTASGGFVDLIIPDGSGGWLSRRISVSVLAGIMNAVNDSNKGWYETLLALQTAYPVGETGWYAMVGSTNYYWNSTTSAWTTSGVSSAVTSVNGSTGVVVLEAVDIDFTSAQGLIATNVRDGIDEIKQYVEGLIDGAGGMYIADYRIGSSAVTVGSNVITFEDADTNPIPFIDNDYTLLIDDLTGVGADKDNAVKAAGTFTVDVLKNGTINYLAVKNTASLNELFTEGTPASAAATGTKGTMQYDTNYLYICIATDTWVRIAHVTW